MKQFLSCDLTEYAGPSPRRKIFLFENRKNGGWGDERKLPLGGFRDGDSWQLQVNRRDFFNVDPSHVLQSHERDVMSLLLCSSQPHVDRRPPAPAAHHCSSWPSC